MASNTKENEAAVWIFFVVNTIILVLSMFKEIDSVLEGILFVLGNVVLWFLLMKLDKGSVCAADQIPIILFCDSMIFFAVKSNEWLSVFQPEDAERLLTEHVDMWIVPAVIGVVLMKKGTSSEFFRFLAFEVWWFVISGLLGYSADGWTDNDYVSLLFLLYTLSNFAWGSVVRVSSVLNAKREKLSWILGLGFWLKFSFLILFCTNYISGIAVSFSSICMNYADTLFKTRNLIILILVSVISVWRISRKQTVKGRYLKASLMVAGTACIIKATMVYYVPGGFLAIFIYLWLMRLNLMNAKGINGRTNLQKWEAALYEPLYFSSGIIAVLFLVSRGMWPVALLGLISVRIVTKNILLPKQMGKQFRVIVLSALTACVAAFFTKQQLDVFLAIGAICAALLLLLYLSNVKHPSVALNRTFRKNVIAGAAVLFMALSVAGVGTKVDVTLDYTTQTAYVSMEANGKNAVITDTSYKWADSSVFVDAFDDKIELSGFGILTVGSEAAMQKEISIDGKILTVVVTDSDGGTTIRKAFVQTFFGKFYQ